MSNAPRDAYWLFGTHAVEAALANSKRKIVRLLSTGEIPANKRVRVEKTDAKTLERLLPPGSLHQGIAAQVLPLPGRGLEEVMGEHSGVLLMLDQVTDPHNVGAILRSAAAFEASAVIMQDRHSPPESGTLAKSASGALEIVPIVRVTNLSQTIADVKKEGYWCAGLDGTASQTLRQAKLGRKTLLVLGAEGKGLRRLTAENCDLLVKLPISARMESLNVSNAAAIALYELAHPQ